MRKKELHNKINDALKRVTIENMLEIFNKIEYQIKQSEVAKNAVVIPQEANFQLPNQFLGTKPNIALDRFFSKRNDLKINYKKINKIIEGLDEIDLESSVNESTDVRIIQNNADDMVRSIFYGKI